MLHAEIATIFELSVVAISARNTMRKFAYLVRLYFPQIAFFNQIVGFHYFQVGSFQECSFFGRHLPRTKISLYRELSISY